MEPLVNTDQLIAVVPAITKYEHTYSKLLLMEVQNEIEVVAFIMHGTEDEETKNFTGEVMVTDLDGNFIIGYRVKQGTLTHTVFDNNNSNKSDTKCETDTSCGFHLSQGEVVVTAPASRQTPYFYITHMFPPLGGGGNNTDSYYTGGGGGGTGTVSSTNNDSTEEDKIDTEKLNNPCVVGIIEELLKKDITLSGDLSHISQYILELFKNSSSNSLYFESSQLGLDSNGNQINAQTTPYLDGWKINLDTDLLADATKLSIAKTIIHETTHAWINYTLQENRTSDMVTDLNLIYQRFKNQNRAFNLTQHEFMGQYVEVFSNSLSVYDNHRFSKDYYVNLSWGGLETSTSYSQLNNQNEIQNIIRNERFNKTDAKSTPCP
ncbi:hypothetical protein GUB10_14220 [Salegentibacter sp. BLCTC]|nr:hypothetical protein [Salegentibacter sp. BLCTC]MBE7641492.1 hypothetical protein [Salegentibacter sp. BLCTC]